MAVRSDFMDNRIEWNGKINNVQKKVGVMVVVGGGGGGGSQNKLETQILPVLPSSLKFTAYSPAP